MKENTSLNQQNSELVKGYFLSPRTSIFIILWVLIIFIGYPVLIKHLLNIDAINDLVVSLRQGSSYGLSIVIFFILLLLALMAPFSSALALILIALPIFGSLITFLISFVAAATAGSISYFIGSKANFIKTDSRFYQRLDRAAKILSKSERHTFWFATLVRAIPNPLYDLWGYAFGFSGARFIPYFFGSALGGIMPLVIVCFGPSISLG